MAEKIDVQKVASLACLKIAQENVAEFQSQLNSIRQFFEKINQMNTDGVEPMVTPHQLLNPLRDDEVAKDLSVEELLSNAPDVKDSLFKVPPVV